MPRHPFCLAMVLAATLAACTHTPPAERTAPAPVPPHWAEDSAAEPAGPTLPDPWWQALQDPVLERLMPLARFTSVEQALARVDEARAQLGQQQATARPQLTGALGAQRGLEQNGSPQLVSRTGPSLQLSWEIDLWGRLAEGRIAADRRSDQRLAESELAQLTAQVQLVELVQQERACRRLADLQAADARSWSLTLALQRERLQAGAQSEQGLARLERQAAALGAQLASTQGQCRSQYQALRALAGVSAETLNDALSRERPAWSAPTPLRPEQPASLLLRHPQVRAASAAADAAAHDLGAARTGGLPSLNLGALLAHQWLSVLGHGLEQEPWSVSGTLAGPLADGGAHGARTDAAQARLRTALATLDQTLRQTVREVESALAQQAAAERQWLAAKQGAEASTRSWRISQTAASLGRLNGMELEEAARQQGAALQALVSAQRDLDLSWTGLIKAAGQAPLHLTPQP